MLLRCLLWLLLMIGLSGCKKEPAPLPPSARPEASASVDQMLNQNQAAPAPPPQTPEVAPAAETASATTAFAGDPVGGQFSLPPAARKKRNQEWLKILKSGTPQQQQQVQDQLTKLSSDELHEITVLYQTQQK